MSNIGGLLKLAASVQQLADNQTEIMAALAALLTAADAVGHSPLVKLLEQRVADLKAKHQEAVKPAA